MSNNERFPQPTREFYEQNQRAALLRNLCLRALDASETMLASGGQDEVALATLLDTNSQLENMGITPNIHVMPSDEPDPDAYKHRMANDPVIASEYIAGQLRNLLIETGGLTDIGSAKTLAEHDELLGEIDNSSLINFRNAGPKAQLFILSLGSTSILQDYLDYKAGPSKLE